MAEEKNKSYQLTETEAQEANQRHHDFYVMAEKAGTLAEEDKPQLAAALQREKDGLVKPLEEQSHFVGTSKIRNN